MPRHHIGTVALAALGVVAVLGGCGNEEQQSGSDVVAGADATTVDERPATTPETTAAERAAQVTPPGEATVLTDFAALMRLFADDPAAPELAERVDELGSSVLDLAAAAERDCGVTFGI